MVDLLDVVLSPLLGLLLQSAVFDQIADELILLYMMLV